MEENKENKRPQFFDNITNCDLDFSIYEKSEYSFDQRITKTNKKSIILMIFNIFRSFVAIGILTLPYGVKMVGPTMAFFELILVAILVGIPTMLLLEVANASRFKGANLEILGKLLWGKAGH